MDITKKEERILCGCLHDVADRLIASNNIVLELAKLDIEKNSQIAPLIMKARRYVLTSMTSTVGVRKMAREKWGMVLISQKAR